MNVLFLTSSYPIFKKGHWQNPSPRHDIAKRLVEKGVNVFVVAPHTGNAAFEETADGVKIYRFGKNAPLDFRKISPLALPKYFFGFSKKAGEVCKKHDIHLVHAFWAIPSGIVAVGISKKFKIPCIVELLGSDVFFGLKNFFTRYFVKKAIEKADFVFADGHSLIDFCRQEKVRMKEIFVHFYEPAVFDVSEKKISEMRKQWGFGEKDLVLMLTRLKAKVYGAEYAIRAMPKILEKIPNAKLLLVGSTGDYERVIGGEIKNSGVEKSIVRAGYLDKPEYWSALGISGIYLSPSLSDSTSVALLEAMFAEKPIVATSIGDNPFWVKNNLNGKIIPAEDANAIADAVVEIYAKGLKKTGSENKKILEKEPCTWEKIIARHIEIYLQLIKH